MKAVIYNDVNDYKIEKNIEEPNINERLNVKIKVEYCGICGSDIHKLLYEKPNSNYVKTKILGHEITGTVIELMPNVKNVSVGDNVVIEPLLYCNECKMCRKDYIQFCENIQSIGKDIGGGFAEYIVVNEKQIHKINDYSNLKKATLCDPYAVAIHIKQISNNISGRKIAIIGDGIIGISSAELFGYDNKVWLFGKHNNRKDLLNNLGIEYQSIENLNKYSNYFDIVIETVGGRQGATLIDAINICQIKGKIIVAGVFDNSFLFNIKLRRAFYKEISIVGCNSFEKNDFESALEYIVNKSKIAEMLISKTFYIDEFSNAIEYIKNRKNNECIKVMIKI